MVKVKEQFNSINNNQSSIHGGATSKVSVVSIQPSIESECVRQNAEILLEMEDAMMDFLVASTGKKLSIRSGSSL